MSWIQTYSGIAFDPEDPKFSIEDIAHSLSLQCRYNGHCKYFYSVAEHCVLLSDWALEHHNEEEARAVLLHDAGEAYCCDIPRPFKQRLTQYKALEDHINYLLSAWHGVEINTPVVKEIDWRILEDERAVLFGWWPMEWTLSPKGPLGVELQLWEPQRAEKEFLSRCAQLNLRVCTPTIDDD